MNILTATSGRADLTPLSPVLMELQHFRGHDVRHLALGQHRWDACTSTHDLSIPNGWPDDGTGIAHQQAAIMHEVAAYRGCPDLALLLGDRFETAAVAMSCAACGIPIVHIGGGDDTWGSLDQRWRWAITAMASLHLVYTETASDRLKIARVQGPVITVGLPGLDSAQRWIDTSPRIPDDQREGILVTVHPETVGDYMRTLQIIYAALDGMRPVVFTEPNQDAGGDELHWEIEHIVEARDGWSMATPGTAEDYYRLMSSSRVMVGNSSSGLTEAPLFGLPVVNIGRRQQGRPRWPGVVDVAWGDDPATQKVEAIRVAVQAARPLSPQSSPFGDGHSVERIVKELEEFKP